MQVRIQVPNSSGYRIKLDEVFEYSIVENCCRQIFLKKGAHTLSICDQIENSIAISMIYSILSLFNNESNQLIADKIVKFETSEDSDLLLTIEYNDCSQIQVSILGNMICKDEFEVENTNIVNAVKARVVNHRILSFISFFVTAFIALMAWFVGDNIISCSVFGVVSLSILVIFIKSFYK